MGIGVEEPTRTLDINGELRVRELKEYSRKNNILRYLTADKKGNIESYGDGLDYVGLGYAKASKVDKIERVESKHLESIDLGGMKVTATIPANKRIVLIVSYSLPIGTSFFDRYSTYFGVRLYREEKGKEELLRDMTRKFTATNTRNIFDMVSITNQYVEEFSPEPEEKTVTFYLKGFVENFSEKTMEKVKDLYVIRFNMFNEPDPNNPNVKNFNWGHAYMTYETLEIKVKDKKTN